MQIQPGFKLIGITIRTTNKNDQAMDDLGNLWSRFYSESIPEKIPHRTSNDIYAVYTDYKSDHTEEYTTIIGVPVASLDEIPQGLTGREFPTENFLRFTARGNMPDAVVHAWMEIWNKDQELNRKYAYDYEVYGPASQKGENSLVEIYISVN